MITAEGSCLCKPFCLVCKAIGAWKLWTNFCQLVSTYVNQLQYILQARELASSIPANCISNCMHRHVKNLQCLRNGNSRDLAVVVLLSFDRNLVWMYPFLLCRQFMFTDMQHTALFADEQSQKISTYTIGLLFVPMKIFRSLVWIDWHFS